MSDRQVTIAFFVGGVLAGAAVAFAVVARLLHPTGVWVPVPGGGD